jgi:hypothetical protein
MISDEFFEVLDRSLVKLMDNFDSVDYSATSDAFMFLKGVFPGVRDSDLSNHYIREQIVYVLDLFKAYDDTSSNAARVTSMIQEILNNKKLVNKLLTQVKHLKVIGSAGFIKGYSRKTSFPTHIDEVALSWSSLVHRKLQEPNVVRVDTDSMGFNMKVSVSAKIRRNNIPKNGVCANTVQDFIDSLLLKTPFDKLRATLKEECEGDDIQSRMAQAALDTYSLIEVKLGTTGNRYLPTQMPQAQSGLALG